MQTKTYERVIDWLQSYQWDEDKDDMIKLYDNLILEELWEMKEAALSLDIVEYLDWLWDTLWVAIIYSYLSWIIPEIYIIEELSWTCNYDGKWNSEIELSIIDELINVIADSNYTKIKDKQIEWEKKGKIIKWPNFVPPTEWIKKIIEKYNITFITE